MERLPPLKKRIAYVPESGTTQSGNECDAYKLDAPSRLMGLPKELWTHVFNFVPQNDKLTHRLVNKEWCKNIDDFSTVDINFNSALPSENHRERVFELRIRTCTFSSLHLPFSPNFKFPLLVKEITFTTRVSASNVLKTLSVCTNIESLRFLTTMTSETSFEDNCSVSSVLNNLTNLQYLEIGILTFLDRSAGQKSQTYNAIIGNDKVLLSSLKTLSLAFTVRHAEWFQFFKFISRHSVTLKCLNTICPCGERLTGAEERSKELKLPNNFAFPQLESLVLNGSSDCACREDIWLLLDKQKQLRRFETDISRGAILLKSIIENNHKTLRALKLHEIGNLYSEELDCGTFRKCLSLQELYLRFEWGYVIVVDIKGGTAQSRMPVLYNLEALPTTLRRLTLCGSQILTSQFARLFSDQRVLEEVTLGRADTYKLKTSGMNFKVFITMLENSANLKKFRIFLDMISELESCEPLYCSELSGVWLKVWEIAKELRVVDDESSSDTNDKCCGQRYGMACLDHQPYIDMIFKSKSQKSEFIERLKEIRLSKN